MFKIGDKVIYGQTGACTIEDICEKELIKNQKKQYYVLRPIFQQNNIIYAPSQSDRVFMRPIITKEQADEIISGIPFIIKAIPDSDMTQEEYKEHIATHDCRDLVRLTARIYKKRQTAKKNNKKLGFSDEKYMKLAEQMLFGELAVALDIPYDKVPEYIEHTIN